MSLYRVVHASVRRDCVSLRVVPENEVGGSGWYTVEGDPEKLLRIRTGRHIYDDDGNLLAEVILIMEMPDFDVTTIIGKRIVSVPKPD